MIKSMTGFGSAEGEVGGARVSVEIRSVNHRFFNPSIKLPSPLSKWEGDVREALRKGVARGHVTLFARVDRPESEVGRIDEQRFAAYVEQLRQLQTRFGLVDTLDVGTVLRMPDVLASTENEDEGTSAELVAIVERAVAALDAMRTRRGFAALELSGRAIGNHRAGGESHRRSRAGPTRRAARPSACDDQRAGRGRRARRSATRAGDRHSRRSARRRRGGQPISLALRRVSHDARVAFGRGCGEATWLSVAGTAARSQYHREQGERRSRCSRT